MPQSLSNVLVHIVFSTKERSPLLADPILREEMHKHLAILSAQLRCPTIAVGGVEDHVHILADRHAPSPLQVGSGNSSVLRHCG